MAKNQWELQFNEALLHLSKVIKPSRSKLKKNNLIADTVISFFLINLFQYLSKKSSKVLWKTKEFNNFFFFSFQIFNTLKVKSEYKIDRIAMAGSSGKKTTIIKSDMDAVLFINNEQPMFGKVLLNWADVLKHEFGISATIRNHSIEFQFKGLEFDLLPGSNLVPDVQCRKIRKQRQRTLKCIAKNPSHWYAYNGALAESVVEFIKRQGSFEKQMIRVAKFWYKTRKIPYKISGAKTMIEMIAVWAAQKELKDENSEKNKKHLNCFRRFLEYIEDFDSLWVYFEEEYGQHYYKNVAEKISKTQPCVLDPSNPFNNLAKPFIETPKCKNLLIEHAKHTNELLSTLLQSNGLLKLNGALKYVFECTPDDI